MLNSLFLAWKYILFNKIKTATLIACITIILFLPTGLEILLDESERQLMSRAEVTPLIVGAKGSALDLVMNTLYFDDELPESISLEAVNKISESGLGLPVPVYIRFKARDFPIIGTTLDYLKMRSLRIAEGRSLAVLGECVVGAKAAGALQLSPGDSVVSSPESLFDIAGVYPLKMHVVGILEPQHTSDDLGIFVDLKTAWVIQGLGHGHQDVSQLMDPTLISERSDQKVTATSKLFHFNEITDDNRESFHFHGDLRGYPITAVIVFPQDPKSETILRGRYLSEEERHQIIKPTEVIDGLLQNIFRIKNVLDAVIAVVAVTTFLAMILVFALSLRLRQREIETIFKLGCRKGTIVRLLSAEIGIILLASVFLCGAMLLVLANIDQQLVRILFIQ
jgi:putative ABC transport system permease protein